MAPNTYTPIFANTFDALAKDKSKVYTILFSLFQDGVTDPLI
jgi:hypothetical protein